MNHLCSFCLAVVSHLLFHPKILSSTSAAPPTHTSLRGSLHCLCSFLGDTRGGVGVTQSKALREQRPGRLHSHTFQVFRADRAAHCSAVPTSDELEERQPAPRETGEVEWVRVEGTTQGSRFLSNMQKARPCSSWMPTPPAACIPVRIVAEGA